MLDLESRLRVFFASAPQNVYPIQVIEISHSQMLQTFYLWKEPYNGSVRIDGTTTVAVQPVNMEIKLSGSGSDLDQKFEIRLSTVDIENIFRDAMDSIPINTAEKVRVVYREYLSDDLLNEQAKAILQVETVSYAIGGASIAAVSPRLNISRTGEVYSPRDIPMLRGFT